MGRTKKMNIYSFFILNSVRFGLSGRTSSQTAIQEWFDTFGETEIVGDLFRNWSWGKRNGKKPEEKSLIKSVIRKEIIGETPPLPEKDPSPIPLIQARNFRPIFSDSIATTTDKPPFESYDSYGGETTETVYVETSFPKAPPTTEKTEFLTAFNWPSTKFPTQKRTTTPTTTTTTKTTTTTTTSTTSEFLTSFNWPSKSPTTKRTTTTTTTTTTTQTTTTTSTTTKSLPNHCNQFIYCYNGKHYEIR